jgi:hypothetical protein
MKKYILWILAAMGSVGCSSFVNTNELGIRGPAITYPAPGTNMAAVRERNLNQAIDRSMEDQERSESVEWEFTRRAPSHY